MNLFKQHQNTSDLFSGDALALYLNAVGSGIMCIGAIALGGLILYLANKTYPPTATRRKGSVIFACFLIFLGVGIGMDLLGYWHNYGYIRGLFKNLAGISFILICFIARKATKDTVIFKNIMELKETMEETNKKIDELKKIAEKL